MLCSRHYFVTDAYYKHVSTKIFPSCKIHKATSRIKAGVYIMPENMDKETKDGRLRYCFSTLLWGRSFNHLSCLAHTLPVLCVSVFWLRFLISCCSLEFLRMNYEYGWIMPLSPPLSSLAHTYISPGCGCGTALAPHISPGKIGFVKIHNPPQPMSAKYKGKRRNQVLRRMSWSSERQHSVQGHCVFAIALRWVDCVRHYADLFWYISIAGSLWDTLIWRSR